MQDFLESEGIIVNESEDVPTDPYVEKRTAAAALRTYNTPSSFDKLKQFLEMDRKVLRFFCVWDDRDAMFGEMRPFIIHVSTFCLCSNRRVQWISSVTRSTEHSLLNIV